MRNVEHPSKFLLLELTSSIKATNLSSLFWSGNADSNAPLNIARDIQIGDDSGNLCLPKAIHFTDLSLKISSTGKEIANFFSLCVGYFGIGVSLSWLFSGSASGGHISHVVRVRTMVEMIWINAAAHMAAMKHEILSLPFAENVRQPMSRDGSSYTKNPIAASVSRCRPKPAVSPGAMAWSLIYFEPKQIKVFRSYLADWSSKMGLGHFVSLTDDLLTPYGLKHRAAFLF